MQIEIDTSSRLDQSGNTVFAFSNYVQKAILLRQITRDQCLESLVGRKLSKELRIFAACVYLLIRDNLNEITAIRIDQEYPNHEGELKRYLINIIQTHHQHLRFKEKHIEIVPIGKRSPAHEVAWTTLRNQRKAARILKTEDILNLLIKLKTRGFPV